MSAPVRCPYCGAPACAHEGMGPLAWAHHKLLAEEAALNAAAAEPVSRSKWVELVPGDDDELPF